MRYTPCFFSSEGSDPNLEELKFCRKIMNKILKKYIFYNIIILKKCIVGEKPEVKYVF